VSNRVTSYNQKFVPHVLETVISGQQGYYYASYSASHSGVKGTDVVSYV